MSAVICSECHIEPTTREDGICYGCMLALKDDTGIRNIAESKYDLDDLGHWATDARGVRRLVKGPPAPTRRPPLRPVEAKTTIRARPMPRVDFPRRFTDDECRDGRARYVQGDRSPLTLAQNREYGRVMQVARRRNKTRPRKVA